MMTLAVFASHAISAGSVAFQWSNAEAIDHSIFSLKAQFSITLRNIMVYNMAKLSVRDQTKLSQGFRIFVSR